jgi:hypothetical protein
MEKLDLDLHITCSTVMFYIEKNVTFFYQCYIENIVTRRFISMCFQSKYIGYRTLDNTHVNTSKLNGKSGIYGKSHRHPTSMIHFRMSMVKAC